MTSKVLWGEGLFLRPQHFQMQDLYHEERLASSIDALHPYAWGVLELRVDLDALKSGSLRLLGLRARFPDGDTVDSAKGDPLPPPIDLAQLQPSQQTITYYAALPAFKPFGGNADQSGSARFLQDKRDAADLFTQAPRAEVICLKKELRLVADSEPRDSYVSFPLLRLRRAAAGGFELDPAFVAPSLAVNAAEPLVLQLRRLIDALQAKVGALYGHHREPSKNVIEYRSGDMSSFWLLHTASTAHAALAHYYHHPALHPERLYAQLLGVAGSLMTFSKSWKLSDLPPYSHVDPGPAFATLNDIIRELLDTVISSKYFAIALAEVKPCYHHGKLDSGKIDEKTTFYLAVGAAMPAIELVEVVPVRFKVGAPDDVDKFVLAAMPGVRLQHAPQVPAAVPVRPDTCYFTIEAKGQMYERMLQAQSISIYVPAGIKDLKLDLVAVAG